MRIDPLLGSINSIGRATDGESNIEALTSRSYKTKTFLACGLANAFGMRYNISMTENENNAGGDAFTQRLQKSFDTMFDAYSESEDLEDMSFEQYVNLSIQEYCTAEMLVDGLRYNQFEDYEVWVQMLEAKMYIMRQTGNEGS